jgi:peptide chain release factor 3
MGADFKGVYHLIERKFYFFSAAEKSGQKANMTELICEPDSDRLLEFIDEDQRAKLIEELALLSGVLGNFNREAFLKGQLSPAIFGSAKNLFGVPTFLDFFHDHAPGPQPKPAQPQSVDPLKEKRFTAFVFKIQANMDKAHRDRVAFMRICSGRFARDMDVKHARLEKTVRLSHSKQFLAQDRKTVDTAFGGDIIGVHDPGHFMIGDTLYESGQKVQFDGIPSFSPENFAKVRLRDPLKRKQLQKGIDQLSEEGLVQLFVEPKIGMQDPILGVVGVLQFDVMMFRLKEEYGVEAVLEPQPFTSAKWLKLESPSLDWKSHDYRVPVVLDRLQRPVLLFKSEWEKQYTQKNLPAGIVLS